MADQEMNEFVLERVFDAPVSTVWQAWTDPELMVRWYKPNADCETAVLEHDLRPGGVMRYEMRFPQMPPHLEHWEFEAIEPETSLRWVQMLVDPDGNVAANPQMPHWPKAMHATIDLEDQGGKTLQRLTWKPYEPTDAEMAAFRAAADFLDQGWVGGFDNLAKLLETQ